MVRLFLSSYKFGNAPRELEALVEPGAKAAVIMNALDVYGQRLPNQVTSNIQTLAELGIEAVELDLRDYFGQPDRLRDELGQVGLIWAVGGNAFLLRRAMRASGLDDLALARVSDGSLVWAGFSAGSVVAAPSLKGIEIIDDPDAVPDGYQNTEAVWNGLGLVGYSIVPHYRSDHPDSESAETLVTHFEATGVPYRALRDGEVIVVTDDGEYVAGAAHLPTD